MATTPGTGACGVGGVARSVRGRVGRAGVGSRSRVERRSLQGVLPLRRPLDGAAPGSWIRPSRGRAHRCTGRPRLLRLGRGCCPRRAAQGRGRGHQHPRGAGPSRLLSGSSARRDRQLRWDDRGCRGGGGDDSPAPARKRAHRRRCCDSRGGNRARRPRCGGDGRVHRRRRGVALRRLRRFAPKS